MNRPAPILVAVLLLAGACGCSRPTGVVSGKVAFNGAPITSGTVTFISDDGQAHSCSIEPDGRYSVPGIPTGPCTISVTSVMPPHGMWDPEKKETVGAPGSAGPPAYVRIPPRYNDAAQSGLTFDVKTGLQSFDIEMKP